MSATYYLYQTVRNDDDDELEGGNWPCANLHDAVQDLSGTRTNAVDGVEYTVARYTEWNDTLHLTVQNGMEFHTGCREERSLAVFPITRTTAKRLARLLNAEWNA